MIKNLTKALSLGALLAVLAGCDPSIATPFALAWRGGELWIEGANLDYTPTVPAAQHLLVLTGPGGPVTIAKPAALEWSATRIRVSLPAAATSAWSATVQVTGHASATVPLRIYARTDVIMPPGAAALPVVVERAANGRFWIGAEYASALYSWAPGEAAPTAHTPPTPPGFFKVSFGSGAPVPSTTSAFNDGIAFDAAGTVYWTQGGMPFFAHQGWPGTQGGRIVAYTPSTGAYACYNLSARSPEAVGLVLHDGVLEAAQAGDDSLATVPLTSAHDCLQTTPATGVVNDPLPAPSGEWQFPSWMAREPASGDLYVSGQMAGKLWRRRAGVWTSFAAQPTTRAYDFYGNWPNGGPQPVVMAMGTGKLAVGMMGANSADVFDLAAETWTRYPAPDTPTFQPVVCGANVTADGAVWVPSMGMGETPYAARPMGVYLAGVGIAWFPPLAPVVAGQNAGFCGSYVAPDGGVILGTDYFGRRLVYLERVP